MATPNSPQILPTNDNINARVNVDKVFTPEECAKILKMSETMPLASATVSSGKDTDNDYSVATELRKSEVRWASMSPDTKWIYDRIGAVINELNKHYRFEITGIEALQIARYTEGSFFDWHVDIGVGDTSKRKLSFSVQLSDSDDYEGGELLFRSGQADSFKSSKNQGDAIVFPTFLPHQVTEITKGIRWSMVGWVTGPPFR